MNPKPVTILCVENDTRLARLVRHRLGRAGMVAIHAGSGEAGIEELRRKRFDLAITDYRLPDCDGLEVIRAAKELDPGMPLIMLSGAGDLRVAVDAMKLGAEEYLLKDVEGGYLDILPTAIARLLENRRLRIEKARIEAELAEERALSRLAVDSISQGLCLFDAQQTLALCNHQFLILRGYPESFGHRGTPLETFLRFDLDRGEFGPKADES
ncbi:MAG: response regulator, partial [Rhodospirillales bacterium]|nr:response regulator [Rhodospirillales bacterium]